MRQQEPTLTDELIVKQSFISLLLPFVPKGEKGQSIEESAKCIIAILDLSSIAIKLYFGVPIGYVDVFNAGQDVMSIV